MKYVLRLGSLGFVFLSCGLAWLINISALAAEPALLWPEAIQETERNNPELKSAAMNLAASQAEALASRAGRLPVITTAFTSTVSANDLKKVQSSASGGLNSGHPTENHSVALTATETIFDGFLNSARMRLAQAKVQEAELIISSLKSRLSFELKSTYAAMLVAQKFLRLYEDILRRRQENLNLVELRFAGGRENKGAALLSEAYLKQARFEELQLKNSLAVTRAKLNRILGRTDTSRYVLKGELPLAAAPGIVDYASLAQHTPEYQLTLNRQAQADVNLSLVRAGFYPTLGLRGSVGRQGPEFFPANDQWSISLVLTIPIFNGGSDYYANEAAIAKLTAAGLNRENIRSDQLSKLQQAHAGFLEASEKLKVDESFQAAVSLRAEIARSKYNNGLSSFDDWDLIENDLISRQKNVLSSQRDRVIAEATWEESQGRGVLP